MPRPSNLSVPAPTSPAPPWFADLKQRGLLDETIVLWTGEFGRLPVSQGTDGRDHNRHGFSLWLAGGGFKPGYVHGATDDFGYKSVSDVVPVYRPPGYALARPGTRPPQAHISRTKDGRDSLTDHEVTKAKVVPALLG